MNKNFINKELLIFQVPLGTVVKESGRVIADMMAERQTFVAAYGGLGGLGKCILLRPHLTEHLTDLLRGPLERRKLWNWNLKTIADIGLVSTKINSVGRNESKK